MTEYKIEMLMQILSYDPTPLGVAAIFLAVGIVAIPGHIWADKVFVKYDETRMRKAKKA